MAKSKWNKVGSLWKNDKGNLNIKMDSDVKSGTYLNLQDPRKSLERSLAAGRMTEEEVEARLAKVPENLRYELFHVTEEK